MHPPLYMWQQEALSAWVHHGRRGIIEAVTGSGKTNLALAAVEDHLRSPGAVAAVVVPTADLLYQWQRNVASWLCLAEGQIALCGDGHHGRVGDAPVALYVAASAGALLPSHTHELSRGARVLLVADECHRMGAEGFARALRAPFAATLGLSATPERQDDGFERHIFPGLGPVVYRYLHGGALRDDVISDFAVAFIGVPFTLGERVSYDEHTERLAGLRRQVEDLHPTLHRARFFFQELQRLAKQNDASALAYLGQVQRRQQLIRRARGRADFVAWLVYNLRPDRAFVFHSTIDGADWIAEQLHAAGIPAAAHHSLKSKAERKELLRQFSIGDLRVLTAARTLDEGIDAPDAELAVIASGSSVKRQRIQRMGRVLRRSPHKHVARILVVYVEGSREDPTARDEGDAYAEAMESIGRASWFSWPNEANGLREWLLEL